MSVGLLLAILVRDADSGSATSMQGVGGAVWAGGVISTVEFIHAWCFNTTERCKGVNTSHGMQALGTNV